MSAPRDSPPELFDGRRFFRYKHQGPVLTKGPTAEATIADLLPKGERVKVLRLAPGGPLRSRVEIVNTLGVD